MKISFWSRFEEKVIDDEQFISSYDITKTRQSREAPDQETESALFGTTTKTSVAREEPDQDPHKSGFSAFPMVAAKTRTITEAREEPDQDDSSQSYCGIPKVSKYQ